MKGELDLSEDEKFLARYPRILSKIQKSDEPQDGDPENPQTKYNTFPFVIHDRYTPNIADKIFGLLDIKSLAKCRRVAKVWKDIIDSKTGFWGNVPAKHYCLFAAHGKLNLCQNIVRQSKNKICPANPTYGIGWTPLHEAARRGHTDICRLIMEEVEDKNPESSNGKTPMHLACKGGHLETCRLIMDSVSNKNPVDDHRRTPLHYAADNIGRDYVRCELSSVTKTLRNFKFAASLCSPQRGRNTTTTIQS